MTGADLKAKPLEFLQQHFGKSGEHFYWIARGVDHRPVRPDRIRKSIGAENTFARDLSTLEDLWAELMPLCDKVWSACERNQARGRTVTLKLKWSDFTQITRARSQAGPIAGADQIKTIARGILADEFPLPHAVRLIGVSVSSLDTEPENKAAAAQLSFL
jgi:DNA polymerase-4